MSKAYRGKTCVYCVVEGTSETADHVIARAFIPVEQRANLPKVPACSVCNRAKSELETYLSSVMPFGGSHPLSAQILEDLVPRRLANNRRVHRELAEGLKDRTWVTADGNVQSRRTINIDADKVEQLYRLIVHGLCWAEWSLLLPPANIDVQVGFLNPTGEGLIGNLFHMKAKRRCHRVLAGGLFQYEGIQALDNDSITIWRMSLYGVRFADPVQATDTTIACYASTAPIGKALPFSDL